jgi:hypothetical protein
VGFLKNSPLLTKGFDLLNSKNMSKTIKKAFFLSLVSILAIYGLNLKLSYSASVTPVLYYDNPTCQDLGLGYLFELKIDPPVSGTYNLPDNSGSVTVNITGQGTFDWSSTFGIDAVIAKGGQDANVYFYNPESTGDTNLVTPTNPKNNKPYGLSHITFCFDVDSLEVSKTATTSFTRTWNWNITKSASTSTLLLADGEIFPVNYSITVNTTSTDSDWNVSGQITITNPSGNPDAIISSVDDVLSISGPVSVNCGVSFPHNLLGGQTLTCIYSQNLSGPINQTNTVTATTSGLVPGGSASAPVVFSSMPTNEIDECATINDTNLNGPNGWTVCSGDVPTTTTYTVNFGKNDSADVKLECGLNTYTNTSTLTTNDTNTSTTSSWTIDATVACTNGCTLTQGYWKTHNNSFKGGAPADPTWNRLSLLAEKTPFFTTTSTTPTWFEIFWMPPSGGNAYLQLAHQYMAAKLNILKETSAPSIVLNAISWAESFFRGKTPSTRLNKQDANQARYYASILASYNEGLIGPGHCSE